jgi:hypothetical protein
MHVLIRRMFLLRMLCCLDSSGGGLRARLRQSQGTAGRSRCRSRCRSRQHAFASVPSPRVGRKSSFLFCQTTAPAPAWLGRTSFVFWLWR